MENRPIPNKVNSIKKTKKQYCVIVVLIMMFLSYPALVSSGTSKEKTKWVNNVQKWRKWCEAEVKKRKMKEKEEQQKWYYKRTDKVDMLWYYLDTVVDVTDSALAGDEIGELADNLGNFAGGEARLTERIGKITNGIGDALAAVKTFQMLSDAQLRPNSPVNSLRHLVVNIAVTIRVVDRLGGMCGPPGTVLSKAVIAFLKVYQAGLESAIRGMDKIGKELGTLNKMAIELGELDSFSEVKEPGFSPYLYPGAEAYSEEATKLLRLRREQPYFDMFAYFYKFMADYLKTVREKIYEFEEVKFPEWIKKVAKTADDQIKAGQFDAKSFALLQEAMKKLLLEYSPYLGDNSTQLYQDQIEPVIKYASENAKEGAEAMLLLKKAGERLKYAEKIIKGCKKYDMKIAYYEKLFTTDQKSFKEAMVALETKTPPLIKRFHKHGLWDALLIHDAHGAKLTAEEIEENCTSIEKLLTMPAHLVRVNPKDELISLPPTITYPHKISLKVKMINALELPLADQDLSFLGKGELQVTPVTAHTDKKGMAVGSVTLWKEFEKKPAGSSIEVYCYRDSGEKIRKNFMFAKPGKPASIVTLSKPQAIGAPTTELPDPWIVQVKDKDDNVINNIPLTLQFEAVNGGKINPIKASLPFEAEGEAILPDEAKFSAQLALGPEDGKKYRFRVRLIKPSGYFFQKEIVVQADKTSKYGKGERELATQIKFSFRPTKLALDTLTSDVSKYPREASFFTSLSGGTVDRDMCIHYKKSVKKKEGGKEKPQVDFQHPYDRFSSKREIHLIPSISMKPSGVALVDKKNHKLCPKKSGRTEMKATVDGITGYEKSNSKCSNTIVKTGKIESKSMLLSVNQVKDVAYTCQQVGDHFFYKNLGRKPIWDLQVQSMVTVSDGKEKKDFSGDKLLHIEVQPRGDTFFTADPKKRLEGVLSGLGSADIYAYLKDSEKRKHYDRRLGKVTLNTFSVKGPSGVRAGEQGTIIVRLQGPANMRDFYCQWFHEPQKGNTACKGRLSHMKTNFRRTGPNQWVSHNYISYPQDSVKPSGSSAFGDMWKMTIYSKEGESKVGTLWNHTNISAPHLNKIYIKAKRPQETGDVYTTSSFDLFGEKGGRTKQLLTILPVGIFAKNIEKPLNFVKWSLGESEYKSPKDIAIYTLRSEESPVDLRIYFNKIQKRLYLHLNSIRKTGRVTLKAMGGTGLSSMNYLDITCNFLDLESIKQGDTTTHRLLVYGPAAMNMYRARWHLVFDDAGTQIRETIFGQDENELWSSPIQERGKVKSIRVEIIDSNNFIVGSMSKEMEGTVVNWNDKILESILGLFHAYEQENSNTFFTYVSPDFRGNDNSGHSLGFVQLQTSLSDDFRNLEGLEFQVYTDPPSFSSPETVKVEMRWGRRAILAVSGQEWWTKDRGSTLIFTYNKDTKQYLLASTQGDAIFGLSSPIGLITIPAGSIVEGESIPGCLEVEEGKVKPPFAVEPPPVPTVPTTPTIDSFPKTSAWQGYLTSVIINGSNFHDGAQVQFSGNGLTIQSANVLSSYLIHVKIQVADNATPGERDVTVTNPSGEKATADGLFILLPKMEVFTINPPSGEKNKTLDITITGNNFRPGVKVSFTGSGIIVNTTNFINSTEIRVNGSIALNASPNSQQLLIEEQDVQGYCGDKFFKLN